MKLLRIRSQNDPLKSSSTGLLNGDDRDFEKKLSESPNMGSGTSSADQFVYLEAFVGIPKKIEADNHGQENKLVSVIYNARSKNRNNILDSSNLIQL